MIIVEVAIREVLLYLGQHCVVENIVIFFSIKCAFNANQWLDSFCTQETEDKKEFSTRMSALNNIFFFISWQTTPGADIR
jgi:hypothetical protein